MPQRPGVLAILRILVPRTLVTYAALRALLVVVAMLLAELAGAEAAQGLVNPLGVVLLAAAVGFADTRRRGERFLWANLGLHGSTIPALHGLTALVGEAALLWWLL